MSSHNTRNQNTRDFIKKFKFCDSSNPPRIYNKKNISKFAAHMLVKKYMKLKRTNLKNPPTRAIMNFLLKLLTFRILIILTN